MLNSIIHVGLGLLQHVLKSLDVGIPSVGSLTFVKEHVAQLLQPV